MPGRTSARRTSAREDKFPQLFDSIKKGLALVLLVLVLLALVLLALVHLSLEQGGGCSGLALVLLGQESWHSDICIGYILPTIVGCCSLGGVSVCPSGTGLGHVQQKGQL